MAAGSIVIDLLMRTGSFSTDTDRAAKDLEKLKKEARETGAAIGESLKGLAAAAGIGISIGGLTALVKGAIDAADNLNDLSKKTGIAVDTLGGMGFAASLAGGDLESVASAAGKLNKSIAEAAAGNKEAAEAFRAAGVQITDSAGAARKADAVMADLADRFAEWEDGPEKAALALKIFGKAGADIIPLLDDGGAALRENIEYYRRFAGVTAEVASQSDQFNDTLAKLGLISGSFGRTLAAELLPMLQAVADEVLNAKEGTDLFKGSAVALRTALEALVVTGATVKDTFVGVGDTIAAYLAVSQKLLSGDIAGAKAIGEAYRLAGEERRKALDAFNARVLQQQGQDAGRRRIEDRGFDPTVKPLQRAPKLPDAGSKDKSKPGSFTDFDAKIGQSVARLIEGSAPAKIAEINAQLAKLNELEAAGIDSTFISEARAKLYEQLPPKVEAAAEAFRRLEIAGNDATNAAFNTDAMVRYGEAVARLVSESVPGLREANQALREEIAITQGGEEARRAIEQARISAAIAIKQETLALRERSGASAGELDALRKELALLKERKDLIGKRTEADQVAQLRGTVEQGLRGTFTSIFRGDFKSVGEMWKQLLAQMAAEALAAQLTKAIFGGGGTGGGGGGGDTGGWIAAIAKFIFSAKGNAFGPAGLIPFATGGVVDRPTPFTFGGGRVGVMGEAGAEAILPLRRGRDGKLGVAMMGGGGGGGVQITQHITVEAGASRNEVMVAAKAAKDAAVSEIMEMQRRGRSNW